MLYISYLQHSYSRWCFVCSISQKIILIIQRSKNSRPHFRQIVCVSGVQKRTQPWIKRGIQTPVTRLGDATLPLICTISKADNGKRWRHTLNPLGRNNISAGKDSEVIRLFNDLLRIAVFHGPLNPIHERLFGRYTTITTDEHEMMLTMVDIFHVEMQRRHQYSHCLGALVA